MAIMFGRANEAPVIVDGEETTCLVDTAATVSVISTDYCIKRGLTVYPLEDMVPIVGTAGVLIPYAGYVEVTRRFPHIPGYEEEVPLLVIDDTSSDADRVPIQVGTKVIAAVTELIKPDNLHRLNETWKQTYIGTLMACAIKGRKEPEDAFFMDSVKGPVKLRKSVELGPLEQTEVWGYTKVIGHSKRVVVCTEAEDLLLQGQVMSVNTKSELLPHSSKARNLTSKSIRIPTKTTIGEVTPCNLVPPIWNTEDTSTKKVDEGTWVSELEVLFEKLGLNEKKDCITEEDVLQAKLLVKKFNMIFSKNDLDLGKQIKSSTRSSLLTLYHSRSDIGRYLQANMRK